MRRKAHLNLGVGATEAATTRDDGRRHGHGGVGMGVGGGAGFRSRGEGGEEGEGEQRAFVNDSAGAVGEMANQRVF